MGIWPSKIDSTGVAGQWEQGQGCYQLLGCFQLDVCDRLKSPFIYIEFFSTSFILGNQASVFLVCSVNE